MQGGLAGVDGCKAGWIVVRHLETASVDASIASSARELFATLAGLKVLAIDIPIGLSDQRPRACDVAARRLLGRPRGSSVFSAPVRSALAGSNYAEASALSQAACGRKITRQTYGILPKIREVDVCLRSLERPQDWVREIHPEVTFYFWAGGRAMSHRKRSNAGKHERLGLVEQVYPGVFREVRQKFRSKEVGDDDILDALAALWSASRIALGKAVILPERPETDSLGLRMEMAA